MDKFDTGLRNIFKKYQDKMDKAPALVAETALEHFQQSIIKKQWDGKPYQPYKNKKREPSRGALMNRTGNLLRSNKIVYANPTGARLSAGSSKVPYARAHNEGLTIQHKARTSIVTHKQYKRGKYKGKTLFAKNNDRATYSQKANVGAYSVTMPARTFMAKSPSLLRDIKTRFKNNFKTL